MADKRADLRAGKSAEDAALNYLEKQGLVLVTRNYRCRQGEIDLVMRDGRSLVFVEVRYRSSQRFGGALESVNGIKQQRLVHAGGHYLAATRSDVPVRFDVIGMAPGQDGFAISWVKDAFRLN